VKLLGFILIALLFISISVSFYLRNVYFYRDPIRKTPSDSRYLYSPCDGLVVYLKKIENGEVISEKLGESIRIEEITDLKNSGELSFKNGWLLGIYMSPLDVHFNYAPANGTVKKIVRREARTNLPMVDLWEYVRMTYLRKAVNNFSKRFHLENERNTILIESQGAEIVLVEIADKFVNKIDCFVKEGDRVKAGEKISFIRRGSQVDVFVSDEYFEPVVSYGEKVVGAITPIFKRK
jgi:phosphatidylserine decarboxylase